MSVFHTNICERKRKKEDREREREDRESFVHILGDLRNNAKLNDYDIHCGHIENFPLFHLLIH